MHQDTVWKEAIITYFPHFLSFFFPDIANHIDFNKKFHFLDKELQKISKNSKIGKRLADLLVKVSLKNGSKQFILIHTEIQTHFKKDFPKRMFIYNYRILDKYDTDVISLAIIINPTKSDAINI